MIRRTLRIIPPLWVLVAIGAPNAKASMIVLPTLTSTPGGPLVLGSGVALSDMITLTGGDLDGVYPGTLTVGLTGPPSATGPGFGPNAFTVQVPTLTGMTPGGEPTTTFTLKGPLPPDPGTYFWVAIFTAADGSTVSGPIETQVVTAPEPSTVALMLTGIGFLLVRHFRASQRRPLPRGRGSVGAEAP